ncbi:MAG: nuclear transport factor 2 family protein [Myxococcales bacterium]
MDLLDPTQQEILRLEEAALARWCRGDPSGFLEISAPDVVYFDPFLPARVDGLAALSAYYEGLRGKIFASRWELVRPAVLVAGGAAVLTFQFVSHGPAGEVHRWNATEVYRCDPGGWRIVHTHWAYTANA